MRTNIKKHTLNLRDGDWDYIESMFKPNGVLPSVAVRTIISNYVDRKREEERAKSGGPNLDMNIDIG